MKKIAILTLMMFASVLTFAAVDEKAIEAKKVEVKSLIMEAFAAIQKNGKDATYIEMQKKDGKFVRGDDYIFAYELADGKDKDGKAEKRGVITVHAINPKLVGKDMTDIPDHKGNFFTREFVKTAMSKSGEGWVVYYWTHPTTKKMAQKAAFIKRINNDSFIGCGAYMTEE